jgi:putative (di)nucleoside polyphosphate hydrolase
VVAFIYNQNEEVLILNSRGKGDYWGLPQGGIDQGETIEPAVRREVKEETGLTELILRATFKNIYSYTWSKPYTHSGYKGQRQSLCVLEYRGASTAVKTNPFEHKAYRWVKIKDLLSKSSPVHRKQYELFLKKYYEFLNNA